MTTVLRYTMHKQGDSNREKLAQTTHDTRAISVIHFSKLITNNIMRLAR